MRVREVATGRGNGGPDRPIDESPEDGQGASEDPSGLEAMGPRPDQALRSMAGRRPDQPASKRAGGAHLLRNMAVGGRYVDAALGPDPRASPREVAAASDDAGG